MKHSTEGINYACCVFGFGRFIEATLICLPRTWLVGFYVHDLNALFEFFA